MVSHKSYKWLYMVSRKWHNSYKYLSHLSITTYIVYSRWYSYVSMAIILRGLSGLSKWVIELIRVISILIEVITQHKLFIATSNPHAHPSIIYIYIYMYVCMCIYIYIYTHSLLYMLLGRGLGRGVVRDQGRLVDLGERGEHGRLEELCFFYLCLFSFWPLAVACKRGGRALLTGIIVFLCLTNKHIYCFMFLFK